MVPRPTRLAPTRAATLGLVLAATLLACGEKREAAVVPSDAHIFAHQPSGVGIELPAMWAGRYRVADTITASAQGLERQLSLRLIRGDSSLVAEPMVVIRVFTNAGYAAVPADSAGAWWGPVVAKDGARTVTVKPAPGNPLTANEPDAASFDSMMVSLLGKQMRASLRSGDR